MVYMKNQSSLNVLVFGYLGYYTNKLDGQTVKTRSIYEMLHTHAKLDVYYADTQEFRYSIKSICVFIRRLFSCDRLVYLPAHNNLKYLFPIIYIISLVVRYQIIYVVVGGWLPEFLRALPIHRNLLKRIKAILLENNDAANQLKDLYGFQNAGIIPNFRAGAIPAFLPHVRREGEPLRLVFMARVNMLKGLDTLAEVASRISKTYLANGIFIDLYGSIHEPDRAYFEEELVNKYALVRYHGVLQCDGIIDTLRQYDAMLFPTHYFTEGFPGSVLDAYRAGIPVITTKWKYATEFVADGKTGYIVNFENPVEEIVNRISKLYSDVSLLSELKRNAYKESLRYTPETAREILTPFLS